MGINIIKDVERYSNDRMWLRTYGVTGEIDHYKITIGSIWDQ